MIIVTVPCQIHNCDQLATGYIFKVEEKPPHPTIFVCDKHLEDFVTPKPVPTVCEMTNCFEPVAGASFLTGRKKPTFMCEKHLKENEKE